MEDIGQYTFYYGVEGIHSGNMYFRLEEIDNDGSQKYSTVRTVDFDNLSNNSLVVYPNPASSFVNLAFGYMSASWEVIIFAANGALIEKDYFLNSSNAHIVFKQKMAHRGSLWTHGLQPAGGFRAPRRTGANQLSGLSGHDRASDNGLSDHRCCHGSSDPRR